MIYYGSSRPLAAFILQWVFEPNLVPQRAYVTN